MLKLNLKLYLILIIILFLLIFLVALFPSQKKQSTINNQKFSLSPTSPPFSPPFPLSPLPTLIHPTSTGASEDVPAETLNFAQQKQELKKKTPLTENGFTITFDYANDTFIVNLVEPKDTNRKVFEDWLKKNYPVLPLTKFIFK